MSYDLLLQRARERMPASVREKDRFELPKVVGRIEGNKTVISNFGQIAKGLRRPVEHMCKFILRELATPGDIKGNELILKAKLSASRVNDKIRQYVFEFVLCPSCGKPDTDIKKEGLASVMVCSVCGERTPVKSKI